MAVKPYTRWTEDTRVAFLLALRQHGRVREAAAAIGRSPASAYAMRKRDADFAARWDAVVKETQAAWRAEHEEAMRGLALMESEGRQGRERRDGWNADRRARFVTLLGHGETVTAACAAVGLSETSANRLRARSPIFAAAWARALAERTLSPLEAAYSRAVEGWEEPVIFQGQVVAMRRRFSDTALRLLMQREERQLARAETEAAAIRAREKQYIASPESTNKVLLHKLEMLEKAKRLRAEGPPRLDLGRAGEPRRDAPDTGGGRGA